MPVKARCCKGWLDNPKVEEEEEEEEDSSGMVSSG